MPFPWVAPISTFAGIVSRLRASRSATTWLLLASALSMKLDTAQAADPPPINHTSIAVEALKRLKGMDLEANPALKAAVMKVIDSTQGTAQFVELVKEFKVTGQDPALLAFALEHPNEAAGVEAFRMILANQDFELLRQALKGAQAAPAVEGLGNTAEKSAVPLLNSALEDAAQAQSVKEKAIHALVQTRDGAESVLKQLSANALPESLLTLARTELRKVRWPEVQSQVARHFPEQPTTAAPLPSIAQLAKMKGDPARGAGVFERESVGCAKCHQVHGRGTDFGPNLSEIGTKLAKEAIYEAILDPSAGIAFGYEAWQLELKNGDEAFGLLASETSDEIAIKAPGGIVTRYKKSDVASKVQQKTSIMPAGLAATMSQQDLIDLVEYLASLKKIEVAGRPQ
jgi:putative heme-binding domain-containing protein